jgi:PAS domain S-box-containing protein
MDDDEDGFTIRGDWAAPGCTSILGHYRLRDFGTLAVENLGAGLPLVINDNLKELAAEEAATFQNIGIAATICMPLVKEGRLTALMAIHDRVARTWNEPELNLLREVTARSWAHVERVAAVTELRASEERYRTLFNLIESGFCVVEVDHEAPSNRIDYRVIEANPAFYRQTGFSDTIADRWLREAEPRLEEHWYEAYGRVARTGQSERFEQGSDLLGRWFDVFAFPTGGADERRVGVLFNDITARRSAELQLRESEARLRAVVEAAPVGLVFADPSGQITGANGRVEEIIGGPVIQSTGAEDYRDDYVAFHADGRRVESDEYPLAQVVRGETDRAELEVQVPLSDGSRRWVRYIATPMKDDDGELIGGVAVSLNIDQEKGFAENLAHEVQRAVAELEAAQEALRQSQKLEAMGQLTGGVAHDFNNLLTPIIGSLDMLVRRELGSERERRLIDGALQAAERAKTLVQRLLAFARRQPLQPRAVDLKSLVEGMAELIASTSGPQIDVRVMLSDNLPPAVADANQLEMAILNLAVNARDAMPDGGVLTISAARDSVRSGHRSKLSQGHYIRLSVKDTGIGMDQATLSRAVEPFFSTKGIGKGTGLGLSMVHGLASQLDGGMTITSSPGEGTTVDLWLPISLVAVQESGETRANLANGASIGTALLVDDEDLVRMSTADMLMDLGYEVLEASSAEEAIKVVEDGVCPDILVTDHLMPGMSGVELARKLRSRWPELPVLIISGYAEAEGIALEIPRLTKPFRSSELADSLFTITKAAVDGS